ncbi:HisA/HisF-related TIM barrel protein, partial [Okeania sp. SIO2B9]|uniref:HisA/HisF-related TIM barrel protein n=1 Tax=Okeania sp. SIO2B9 TaxID=2607782 RepID=UPI00142AAFC5
MNIIPAIDILDGRCVRLYQGDYQRKKVFNDNPVDVAKRWVDEGATKLHLVDLDGAKVGQPVNQKTIEAIIKAVDVPIQLGGGLRNYSAVASVLALGVKQAIVGTVAVERPQLISNLCQEFPGQIIVGIDARDGKVATKERSSNNLSHTFSVSLKSSKLSVKNPKCPPTLTANIGIPRAAK